MFLGILKHGLLKPLDTRKREMPQETMRKLSYDIASSQRELSELQAHKEDILKQIRHAVQLHDKNLAEIDEKKAANKVHMKNMAALEERHTQNDKKIQQCTQQIRQFETKLHAMQQNHLPEPGLYAGTHLVDKPYVPFSHSREAQAQAHLPHSEAQAKAARQKHFYTTSTNRQMGQFIQNTTEPPLPASRNKKMGLFAEKHQEPSPPLRPWNPFDDFFNFLGNIGGGEKHLSSHAKQMNRERRE